MVEAVAREREGRRDGSRLAVAPGVAMSEVQSSKDLTDHSPQVDKVFELLARQLLPMGVAGSSAAVALGEYTGVTKEETHAKSFFHPSIKPCPSFRVSQGTL